MSTISYKKYSYKRYKKCATIHNNYTVGRCKDAQTFICLNFEYLCIYMYHMDDLWFFNINI